MLLTSFSGYFYPPPPPLFPQPQIELLKSALRLGLRAEVHPNIPQVRNVKHGISSFKFRVALP